MKYYFDISKPNSVVILGRYIEKDGKPIGDHALKVISKQQIRQFVEETIKIFSPKVDELFLFHRFIMNEKSLPAEELIQRLERAYEELSGAMNLH